MAFFTKKGKTTMKKTLLKVLSSTIALTLVATAAIGTAPKKEIPVQEINARPAQEETVKAPTVLDLVEEKIQEEKAVEVKVVKAAPVAVKAVEKSAPAENIAEPEKAAEEVAVPEVKAPEAAPEIKTEAPKAEEIAAPEENAEPVMVWDVSATEFDNVAMAFYAEPAEARAVEQVEVDVQTGTVYIRGTGAMEEAVYSHFMTVEKFVTAAKALFEEYYGVEVDIVYDETITDVLELDANIGYFNHETGEELYVTEGMRETLTPDAFLEYSPKTIVIEEGITNVSNYAFIFCADLETAILPSTIENIGECAFEQCDSLTTIVIPETAKIDKTAFGYCDSLVNVQLVNADYYANGGMAVHADGENTGIRNLTADEINAYVNYWN